DGGRTWDVATPRSTGGGSLVALDGWLYASTSQGVYRSAQIRDAPTPEVQITSPTHNAVLAAGSTSVELQLDLGGYDGPWQWRLDEPFPDAGPAGGVSGGGAGATVAGLVRGRQHTIHVMPTTSDELVAAGFAPHSVAVFSPAVGWPPPGDLMDTLIVATLGADTIVIMGPDGSDRREFPSPTAGSSAGPPDVAWSPDGSAVRVHQDGRYYRLDVATGEAMAVGRGAVPIHGGNWAPDGRRYVDIIQNATPAARWQAGLYIAEVGVPGRNLLTTAGQLGSAVWSPDGSRIAYLRSTVDPFIISADGSGEPVSVDGVAVSRVLAWTPDGVSPAGSGPLRG
ncbi:MAG: WD40 repeat domain-containing protein, partial [Candidatus Poribacteria bacterium]